MPKQRVVEKVFVSSDPAPTDTSKPGKENLGGYSYVFVQLANREDDGKKRVINFINKQAPFARMAKEKGYVLEEGVDYFFDPNKSATFLKPGTGSKIHVARLKERQDEILNQELINHPSTDLHNETYGAYFGEDEGLSKPDATEAPMSKSNLEIQKTSRVITLLDQILWFKENYPELSEDTIEKVVIHNEIAFERKQR
jgi:hypothetical protein